MSSWLEKIVPSVVRSDRKKRTSVPEGLWKTCPSCSGQLWMQDLEANHDVCPKCDYHMRISARRRLDLFLDDGLREEIAGELAPVDKLKFKDSKRYKDRLSAAQKLTGEKDALVVIRGNLQGIPVVACSFEFEFMGGSMGAVVGAKFVQAANAARQHKIPLICFSASGGARMQEALISLMQMAKTSAAIARMNSEGVPYISILTNPVYGGVSASLAMLGDINIAEPNSLIGFAGPRVIEQTVGEKLPEGFQRSEFLLDHGAIDMIVKRNELRDKLAGILGKLMPNLLPVEEEELIEPQEATPESDQNISDSEDKEEDE